MQRKSVNLLLSIPINRHFKVMKNRSKTMQQVLLTAGIV